MNKLRRKLTIKSFPTALEAGIIRPTKGGRMQGGDGLKATQEYTPEFGEAVFADWEECEPEESTLQVSNAALISEPPEQATGWELAEIDWVIHSFLDLPWPGLQQRPWELAVWICHRSL